MIEQIKLNSVNSVGVKRLGDNEQVKNNHKPQSKPQFTGVGGALLAGVQACEQIPMLNVTVLDLATAIGPRSVYDTVNTNPYAGLETFRRESSGLIVNCLIPSFIVLGFAKLFQKPIMGADSKMGGSWANEETLNVIADSWKATKGTSKEKVRATFTDLIKKMTGFDGENEVAFENFIEHENVKKAITKLTNAVIKPSKYSDKQIKKAFSLIAAQTHVTEHIKIVTGKSAYNGKLSAITEEAPKILKEFIKNNIHSEEAVKNFVKKATRLVTTKSLLGLGVIIPLAISMQPINRWITTKTSGIKGAPIYKDFKENDQKELTPQQKSALFRNKLVSVGAMVGVALLSIMKKPSMKMLKNVTQFSGIFPTMDQARIISTATFASRMMASENNDELRETTVRDIATFSAFYFLGDYVAKGIATFMDKKHNLINYLEDYNKDSKGLGKFWQWAKNTSLKSSSELVGATKEETAHLQKLRSICQVGNIGFSLLALGVLIPVITKNITFKKREEQLKKMGVDPKTIKKYYNSYPNFKMNNANANSKGNVYQAFFTSK